jgi:hypothetical protein
LQQILRFFAEAGPGGEEIKVIRSHGDECDRLRKN